MRRDQLEPGLKYVGSDKQCYEIVDLTPGWRIGYDRDWVKDDSTRLRTMNGKKVPFRKNNALRAIVHWIEPAGTTSAKVVVLPSRLLRLWDQSMVNQSVRDTERANAALKESVRLTALLFPERKMNNYTVLDDGCSVRITTEDLCTLLALIPQKNPDLDLFPDGFTIDS